MPDIVEVLPPLHPSGGSDATPGEAVHVPTVSPQRVPRGAPPERLLSVSEVARLLRVSRATAYRLCERGEVRHIRVGNTVRVSSEELAAFLAQRLGPGRPRGQST